MNQVQTVVNYWMVNTSYSVGVSDTVADASTINTIQATLDEAKKKVKMKICVMCVYLFEDEYCYCCSYFDENSSNDNQNIVMIIRML